MQEKKDRHQCVATATRAVSLPKGPAMNPQCVSWGHMMDWNSAWGGGPAMFWVVHLLWWGVALFGVLVVAHWSLGRRGWRGRCGPAGQDDHGSDQALRLLRERYARGEIDQAEFDERSRVLKA
jgi:putative membrane protein